LRLRIVTKLLLLTALRAVDLAAQVDDVDVMGRLSVIIGVGAGHNFHERLDGRRLWGLAGSVWLGTGTPDSKWAQYERKGLLYRRLRVGGELVGWTDFSAGRQLNALGSFIFHLNEFTEPLSPYLIGGVGIAVAGGGSRDDTEWGMGLAGGVGIDFESGEGRCEPSPGSRSTCTALVPFDGVRAQVVLQALEGGHNAFLLLTYTLGWR
jgi:hypothetical protein